MERNLFESAAPPAPLPKDKEYNEWHNAKYHHWVNAIDETNEGCDTKTWRMKVPGGWLYRYIDVLPTRNGYQNSIAFVPVSR